VKEGQYQVVFCTRCSSIIEIIQFSSVFKEEYLF
jgi:hypothetical protein